MDPRDYLPWASVVGYVSGPSATGTSEDEGRLDDESNKVGGRLSGETEGLKKVLQ